MRLVDEYLTHAEREGTADVLRPVPAYAINELVERYGSPTPEKPVRREAEIVGFIPAHA